jgi:hypothetical protein
MTIQDLVQPKQKAKIGQRSIFALEFDNINLAFTGGKVNFRFMAVDSTENEGKAVPITLLPFTQQQRDDVEAIFAAVITQMLLDTGFTVEPDTPQP